MFIIRWISGVFMGLLLAAMLVFGYKILEESPKAAKYMESTVAGLFVEGREYVDRFELDEVVEKIETASKKTPAEEVTPEAVDDDPPIATDATPPDQETGIAEMMDAQQIETVEAEMNAQTRIEEPTPGHQAEPVWQEHVLFSPFDSHDRAEYLAQFITENAGVDCYVVSVEDSHAVTIRYMDKLDFYVETIREATGLNVLM